MKDFNGIRHLGKGGECGVRVLYWFVWICCVVKWRWAEKIFIEELLWTQDERNGFLELNLSIFVVIWARLWERTEIFVGFLSIKMRRFVDKIDSYFFVWLDSLARISYISHFNGILIMIIESNANLKTFIIYSHWIPERLNNQKCYLSFGKKNKNSLSK